MKTVAALMFTVLALCAFLAPPPGSLSAPGDNHELVHDGRKWVHVAGYDIPPSMVSRAPLDGAHGASVVGFRVNRKVEGSLIITVIDRPAVAVFIGWVVPDNYIKKAPKDLRVAFETSDGDVHVEELAAGGGYGLLFHSPDGLDIKTITHVALYRDAKAKWAR